MARPRNFHGLLGSRSFSIPTHEQRNVFFSLNDKMNGVMDNWIKSDANENWERHDFENCTSSTSFPILIITNLIITLFPL